MSESLESVLGSREHRRKALKDISDAIDPAARDGLMEIEFLGSAMFPHGVSILKDGSAIAVNKTSLKAAYFEALQDVRQASYVSDDAKHLLDRDKVTEALRTLAVLLLQEPEHVMAVNLRKALLAPVVSGGVRVAKYRELMELEKQFIDSLLTSPLNKHNKSPTLWAHRRWVTIPLFFGTRNVLRDLTNVVMVASEKHPRNYYAWNHSRYLMTLVDWRYDDEKEVILPAVVEWCTRHHDDTSGWSFLQSLLLGQHGSVVVYPRYEQDVVGEVFQDVLRLAYSLRWTNESVWVFLRTIAASTVIKEPEYREFLQTAAALEAGTEDQMARRVLQAAAAWCVKYRQERTYRP